MVGRKAKRDAGGLQAIGMAPCVAFAALICAVGAPAARADGWQSAAQVASTCRADPQANAVAVTFCLGYLQGTLDAFLLGRVNCIPAGTDANGLRQVVIEHLERHPERVSASGPMLVYDAFRAAWPACAQMPAYLR